MWSSIVNAYKSRGLSNVKLDELLCKLELHEQTNFSHKEKSITFVVGKKAKKKKKKEEFSESEQEIENEEFSSRKTANFIKRMM